MRTPFVIIAGSMLLAACGPVVYVPASTTNTPVRAVPAPELPVGVDIVRVDDGRLLMSTNQPAYLAVFEIVPNHGVSLGGKRRPGDEQRGPSPPGPLRDAFETGGGLGADVGGQTLAAAECDGQFAGARLESGRLLLGGCGALLQAGGGGVSLVGQPSGRRGGILSADREASSNGDPLRISVGFGLLKLHGSCAGRLLGLPESASGLLDAGRGGGTLDGQLRQKGVDVERPPANYLYSRVELVQLGKHGRDLFVRTLELADECEPRVLAHESVTR